MVSRCTKSDLCNYIVGILFCCIFCMAIHVSDSSSTRLAIGSMHLILHKPDQLKILHFYHEYQITSNINYYFAGRRTGFGRLFFLLFNPLFLYPFYTYTVTHKTCSLTNLKDDPVPLWIYRVPFSSPGPHPQNFRGKEVTLTRQGIISISPKGAGHETGQGTPGCCESTFLLSSVARSKMTNHDDSRVINKRKLGLGVWALDGLKFFNFYPYRS